MYQVVATFDVPRDLHQEFIAAALEDGRDSRANECGTTRLELIKDEGKKDRFVLIEAYDDEAAFNRHLDGPYARKFLDRFREFEVRPPATGARIEDAGRAAAGSLKLFRIDEAYNRLCQADEDGEFAPPHPENFLGTVRITDLARHAGLTGIDVLAVFFEADARTKPHVHQTEQLLYFVRGNGVVAFPGQAEQVVDEGGIVVVPACELHMHGATGAGPTCHVAVRLAQQDQLDTSRSR